VSALRFPKLQLHAAVLLVTVALLSSCAMAPTVLPEARSELAPTGTLRVGIVVTNAVFATKDASTGELRGVAVDLGRELAKQLGVAFELVQYLTVARMVDGAKAREWDVAFLSGADPARAVDMDFGPLGEQPHGDGV
jgi:polar amino acid transport system substrate-binding protein